jgi:hypothetical protein
LGGAEVFYAGFCYQDIFFEAHQAPVGDNDMEFEGEDVAHFDRQFAYTCVTLPLRTEHCRAVMGGSAE